MKMLLSKKVIQKWNSNNKSRYVDLGYTFTKMGESFEINVVHLPDGSNVLVDIQCDYCGKEYKKEWYRYIKENKNANINTDCCCACKKNKIVEVSQMKHGVNSVLSLEETKDKIKETNIRKYGCDNPFGSELIKQKIYKTNMKLYGHKIAMQSPEIQEKAKQTCEEKYGVSYYVVKYTGYGLNNPRWKGGVAHHRMERSTIEYVNWRNAVYKKDNYTCQCCFVRSSKGCQVFLNAHHIFNWKNHPSLRYEVDNGIALCKECHLLFHSIYGKKDNNDVQLLKFLNEYGKKVC